jgi:D-methionine transport system permease protein
MSTDELVTALNKALGETLQMVGISAVVAVLLGIPLGVLLVSTDRGGLLQNSPVNKVLGLIVNIGRSLPFIILMIAIIPFTKLLAGTSIGASAAVVPLSVGAIPFLARLVETSVREVDGGLVEAAQAMGASTWTIVRKVLVPESLPSIVSGITTTVVTLIGYSAMAGAIGAGGLGDLAISYGYNRFETGVMITTVVVIVVVVQVIQMLGDLVSRRLDHRK